jgi:Xaa-Pro aminopeptidase
MIELNAYTERRKLLMQKVGGNGIVVLPSSVEIIRNGDAIYPFRQNSDFYYLTGFDEPDAVVILAPERKEGEYILFNRARDRAREIWDGPRVGQDGAINLFGANQSFPISQLESLLPELLIGREAIHYPLGLNSRFDKLLLSSVNQIRSKIRGGLQIPIAFVDISPSIHEMRLFKETAEIELMQKAVNITEKAHLAAMQRCQPGLYEYELEAVLSYQFQRHGARYPAYAPIVGSGRNSCVLHYVSNNKKIDAGDLVLIDAGAEYENYAADITRTFPANGNFSAEQREIYTLVLESQLAVIKTIKPGALWNEAQELVVKIITQGLIDLGILKGFLDDLIEKEAYFPFYMHRSGHWLGMDVHDVGRYKVDGKWRSLEPGMVFTVEPGIYIAEDSRGVDKRWHNIGVRIEDNVLVTKNGCQVLSHKIPKTIAEIEEVMSHEFTNAI